MVNVQGKWAFITGASRGIGRLIAEFMAGQGCNLILHSRSLEHLDGVMTEVKAKGVQAYGVAAELSNLDEVDRMLAEIDCLGVQADFVLHNA